MKTITIIRQVSTITMLFVHVHVVNGIGGLDGSDRSCYCGQFTNVRTCTDPADEELCFCNSGGNIYCDQVPAFIPKGPLPNKFAPAQEEDEAPASAPTFFTMDGCSCDKVTNVRSCDHPLKDEYCFCNSDGRLVCDADTPPIGSSVYNELEESNNIVATPFHEITSFICDENQLEIKGDTVIRIGDSVRICLLPQQDTNTNGDMTSINEITEVTCSNGMYQSFSIIPIPDQDKRDHVTSEFEFNEGMGRGFETLIKRDFGGASFTCTGSVSLSTATLTPTRRYGRRRHLDTPPVEEKEPFSLSVNIANVVDDTPIAYSGDIHNVNDFGMSLRVASTIAIITGGLLFL
jgi:hypothetical protein